MNKRTKLLVFLAAISGKALEGMDESDKYWKPIYQSNDYAWKNYPKDKMSATEFYNAIKNAEQILGL